MKKLFLMACLTIVFVSCSAAQPALVVSSLSPSSASAGSAGFTLTVTGTNFRNSSVVLWNGSRRGTTRVNSTQLNASISSADIAAAGNAKIAVLNSATGAQSDSLTFTINPASTITPLSITTTSLAGGTVATSYSATVAAAGGTPPYTWSISSGSLPAGLSLSSAGVISGTPITAGTASFTVMAKDSASSPQTATHSETINVVASVTPLAMTVSSLPGATMGTAYSATLTAIGGTPPYTWSISSGSLPTGLSLSSAGVISGTPTTAGTGTSYFDVTVKDSASSPQAATQAESIAVSSQPPTTRTSTLVITSADNGKTFSNYRISTTSGPCVTINGASNITIQQSDIGPCGANLDTGNNWGIAIYNSSSYINIYDSYIHVETQAPGGYQHSHDGVIAWGGSNHVVIQGNVVAYGECNICFAPNVTNSSVTGNYLLNPRGDSSNNNGSFYADWGNATTSNSGNSASNNYAYACDLAGGQVTCPSGGSSYLYSENTSDEFSIGYSSNFTIQNNWITGGSTINTIGSGIVLDQMADSGQVLNNVLYNTEAQGIAIANGTGHVVSGNKVLNMNPTSTSGTPAIYLNNYYTTHSCGSVTITNNVATQNSTNLAACNPLTQTCKTWGFWLGTNCGTPTMSGNTFSGTQSGGTNYAPGGDPAFQALYPITTTNPAPLIPPVPKSCVARSPYSTQTSAPPCN